MYLTLGVAVAIFWVYILRKQFLGGIWGAVIVAIFGAFLGAVVEVVFDETISFLTNLGGVNVFPPLASAIVVISLFAAVCEHGKDADE